MIFLKVTGVSLSEEFGESHALQMAKIRKEPTEHLSKPVRETYLKLTVTLDQSLHLKEGEPLRASEPGIVAIYPQTSDVKYGSKTIGRMEHLADADTRKRPSSYWIEVYLPTEQFESLVVATRLGRVPNNAIVTTTGMTWGKGSHMEWDIKTELQVVKFYLNIPLAEGEGEEPTPESVNFPPTRAHIFQLIGETRALSNGIQDLNSKLVWLVGLVLLFGIVVLFFRH